MSKYKFLVLIGLFIAALPYLGFPLLWDTIMFTFGGLAIVAVSTLARRAYKKGTKEMVVEKQPVYVESNPPRSSRSRPARPRVQKAEIQNIDIVPGPPSVQTEAE
ncbi:MAG: hypothetical protein Greene041614_1131 [Parcubacteria group bacterium Greene0416_14]|nr:MAG: hypothetical protein Greene041614_1131 [Parcubacteria group bacterium Greene0416_14]